jgi:hypothetical protein
VDEELAEEKMSVTEKNKPDDVEDKSIEKEEKIGKEMATDEEQMDADEENIEEVQGNHLQLVWKMFDLAKMIYKNKNTEESKLKLVEVLMKYPNLEPLCELIREEYAKSFLEDREVGCQEAEKNIMKAQQEQAISFNKKRVVPIKYQVGDLVTIKGTQFLPLSKLKSKYLGPYRVTGGAGPNRYKVLKVSCTEGPVHTSKGSDYMKKWNRVTSHHPRMRKIQSGRQPRRIKRQYPRKTLLREGRMWGFSPGVYFPAIIIMPVVFVIYTIYVLFVNTH